MRTKFCATINRRTGLTSLLDTLHRWQGHPVVVEMQRRLLGLVAGGDETSEEMDCSLPQKCVHSIG
jgi:hypothetical protein